MNNNLSIRNLSKGEPVPYDLLLLADPSKEMIDDYVARGSCYVACLNDEIIGAYVLLKTRPSTIEIVNIAIKEEHQGKGHGKSLVLHAIEQAKECGATSIEIGTGNSSVQQLMLYQKCGFRIVGVDSDFFVRNYPQPIFENGIQCKDMVRLRLDLDR